MYSTDIFFPNLDAVKHFVNMTTKYDQLPISLISGIYNIDAHSIIGIISLDISKPITLSVNADQIPDSFYTDIEPYVYKQTH